MLHFTRWVSLLSERVEGTNVSPYLCYVFPDYDPMSGGACNARKSGLVNLEAVGAENEFSTKDYLE